MMKPTKYFTQVMHQFEQKHDSITTYRQIDHQFLLHPFKIKKFSTKKLSQCYKMLAKRYQSKQIQIWDEDWHKNQRKVFIQFLICFCKINNTMPEKLVHIKKTQVEPQWENMSTIFFGKKAMFLKFQGLSIQKKSRKVQWGKNDDNLVRTIVEAEGKRNWNQISKKLFYSTHCTKYFSPKKIRERWFNHLNQNIKHGQWTLQEDMTILEHVENENKHWCEIVKILNNTRTEHMVKNRYLFLIRPQKNWKADKQMKSVVMILNNLRKRTKKTENLPTQNTIPKTQQHVEQINKQEGKQINLKKGSTENSLAENKVIKEEGPVKQNINTPDNFAYDHLSFGLFMPFPFSTQSIVPQNKSNSLSQSQTTLASSSFYSPFMLPGGNIYLEQNPANFLQNYCHPVFTYVYYPGQMMMKQEATQINTNN